LGSGTGSGSGSGSGTGDRERGWDRKSEKDENQEQYRVVIHRESSECLEKMLALVTDGFEAGDITKSDIANWLLTNALQTFGETEIRAIRQLHFDERKILAALLKDSKNDNNLPENLKKAIREHFGLSDGSKRKQAKDTQNHQSLQRHSGELKGVA
jgi:hypothetical protein